MQDRVNGPAIGVIVLGVLGVIACLVSLFAEGARGSLYEVMQIPPEQREQMMQMQQGGMVLNIVMTLIAIAGSAFIIYAGVQMKNLRNRTMAMIASILVMIPCFTSCCCLIGIPIGIWALVVLSKPEVKEAFTS
jgi:hypothetical protein